MARLSQNVSDGGADEMNGSRFFRGIDKRDDWIDRLDRLSLDLQVRLRGAIGPRLWVYGAIDF
jgi:hypothetical protein